MLIVASTIAYVRWRGNEVEVVVANRSPLVQSVVVAGRMANASRVFLGATITGRVREVPFREGALVKAGQVIVRLEDGEPLFVTELPLPLGVTVALMATLCGVLAAAAPARSAAKLDPAQAIRI